MIKSLAACQAWANEGNMKILAEETVILRKKASEDITTICTNLTSALKDVNELINTNKSLETKVQRLKADIAERDACDLSLSQALSDAEATQNSTEAAQTSTMTAQSSSESDQLSVETFLMPTQTSTEAAQTCTQSAPASTEPTQTI